MYVGVQLKERADTAQPQSLGLPKTCSWVVEEVLSALSVLGQEQRNTRLEGKARHSCDLNSGEDTSALPHMTQSILHTRFTQRPLEIPGRNPRITEPGSQLLQLSLYRLPLIKVSISEPVWILAIRLSAEAPPCSHEEEYYSPALSLSESVCTPFNLELTLPCGWNSFPSFLLLLQHADGEHSALPMASNPGRAR